MTQVHTAMIEMARPGRAVQQMRLCVHEDRLLASRAIPIHVLPSVDCISVETD